MAGERHNTIQEGLIAGFLSATVIVVWLFIVDVIARHPFFTPGVLGRGLVSFVGLKVGDTTTMYVVVYTIFHYVAFAIIGVLVAIIVHAARRTPAVLAGFLITFVMFEVGFYALAATLSINSSLQSLAWYQIGVANLLASVVMFYFMWRRHPELKGQFAEALDGTDA